MRETIYTLAQATWGLPQTLAGTAVFLAHRKRPHFRYHGAIVTAWKSSRALSLGPFVFLRGENGRSGIGEHETGGEIGGVEGGGAGKGASSEASGAASHKGHPGDAGSASSACVAGSVNFADVPYGIDQRLLVHEYGHTVQSLILGPLYLPVIGLPSVIWLNTPTFAARRRRERLSYYSFFTERSANWLGERVLDAPSIGQALID